MDIRTLLICFLAVLTLQAIALLLAHLTRRAMDGTGWMAAAFGALALASWLFVLRNLVSDFWTIIVSNGLFTLGFILLHRAVSEFSGLRRRFTALHLTILTAVIVGVTYFSHVAYDTQMRIVIVSAAYTIESALIASLLVRSTSDTRIQERFMGAMFLLLTVVSALRAGMTWRKGSPTDLMSSDFIQTASFLAFILLSTSIAFGFVWMSSTRRHLTLHRQANRDPLTGLLNRRGFLAIAPMRMRAAQQEGRDTLLLFADIDGLKHVNDTLGHDAGDRVISEAADVLREVLRTSDSVTRLGGDEFCALMSVRSINDTARILERIEEHVQIRNAAPGRNYILGISAATAQVRSQDQRSLEDLLRDADKNMYATKRRRKQLTPSAAS